MPFGFGTTRQNKPFAVRKEEARQKHAMDRLNDAIVRVADAERQMLHAAARGDSATAEYWLSIGIDAEEKAF